MLWFILALLLALTLWGTIRFYKRSMRAHKTASDVVIELNKLAAAPDQDPTIAIETLLVAETFNPGEYAEAAACARDTLERLADFDPNDEGTADLMEAVLDSLEYGPILVRAASRPAPRPTLGTRDRPSRTRMLSEGNEPQVRQARPSGLLHLPSDSLFVFPRVANQ